MPQERDDAAGRSVPRTNLASRREIAHDLNNWLTAKAGFLALLEDEGPPEEDEACRRNLVRAQDGLEGLVRGARDAGMISDRQAAVLLADDIEAARSIVEEVRSGRAREGREA